MPSMVHEERIGEVVVARDRFEAAVVAVVAEVRGAHIERGRPTSVRHPVSDARAAVLGGAVGHSRHGSATDPARV